MLHTGKSVNLPEEAEEVAGFYAALLETPHAEDVVFNKNFFRDWLEVLKRYPPVCLFLLFPLSALGTDSCVVGRNQDQGVRPLRLPPYVRVHRSGKGEEEGLKHRGEERAQESKGRT